MNAQAVFRFLLGLSAAFVAALLVIGVFTAFLILSERELEVLDYFFFLFAAIFGAPLVLLTLLISTPLALVFYVLGFTARKFSVFAGAAMGLCAFLARLGLHYILPTSNTHSDYQWIQKWWPLPAIGTGINTFDLCFQALLVIATGTAAGLALWSVVRPDRWRSWLAKPSNARHPKSRFPACLIK